MEALNKPGSGNMTSPKVILLDVYSTLLDMTLVRRRVNDLMDNRRGYRIWFELFMQYCFVDNCTSRFNDFFSIAVATLKMAAKLFHRSLREDDIKDALQLLNHLPLRENVQQGLSELADLQFRLGALTNAPAQLVTERMERTGLVSYFEMVLSAEQVKKYKPCREVYEWAAQKFGVQNNEVLFVSSHSWDIAGAANVGMQTAYIEHDDEMLYPLAPSPTLIINNLEELPLKLKGSLQD